MEQLRPYNLLAISDVHLGCDVREGAPQGDRRRDGLDRALVSFLDHHATRREGGRPWRLLLLGDVFDFVAVTALPPPGLTAPFQVSADERRFGLANEEEKCVWKVRRVAARNEEVFHALARFLVAGHELHFVRGNHDAELHWPAVQAELRRLFCKRAGVEGAALAALEARVQFHAWFYLEPGLFYAEHGNAHDRYCLQSGFFDEAPRESGELELPMSSKVLRWFAARWAEDQEELDQADQWGLFEYLAWVMRMGNPLTIGVDYFAMVLRVLRPMAQDSVRRLLAPASARKPAAALAAEEQSWRLARVERWLARFGDEGSAIPEHATPEHATPERSPLPQEPRVRARAQALFALASRPAEQSLLDGAQLFYLDRMALALVTGAAALGAALCGAGPLRLLGPVAAALCFALGNALLARRRNCDAHPLLKNASRRVAQIFDVRFVVMGHSHRAVDESVSAKARYLNLGAWRAGDGALPHVALVGERAELRRFTLHLEDHSSTRSEPSTALQTTRSAALRSAGSRAPLSLTPSAERANWT
jgi:UDP-2,3-diacylglucosamine pyrophosphatase LpxH